LTAKGINVLCVEGDHEEIRIDYCVHVVVDVSEIGGDRRWRYVSVPAP
jgi:hypothetical protein